MQFSTADLSNCSQGAVCQYLIKNGEEENVGLSRAMGLASLPESLAVECSVSDEREVSYLLFFVEFTVRQMTQVDDSIFCENLWVRQFWHNQWSSPHTIIMSCFS